MKSVGLNFAGDPDPVDPHLLTDRSLTL